MVKTPKLKWFIDIISLKKELQHMLVFSGIMNCLLLTRLLASV